MVVNELIWTRRASIQLERAQSELADTLPIAAKGFVSRVFEMVEELMQHPDIGEVIPEYEDPDFRERVFGNYRILYSFQNNTLKILAVIRDDRAVER